MHSVKRILVSALIAGLVCAGEAALFAAATAAAELPQSVTVRFADLNLERPADVARLYHRIRNAAQSACGARDLELTNWLDPAWQHCVYVAVGPGRGPGGSARAQRLPSAAIGAVARCVT